MKHDDKDKETRTKIKPITNITPGNLLMLYTLGYVIKKKSDFYAKEITENTESFPINWRVSNGTFFYVLNKLKKNGFIINAENESAIKEINKYYSITNVGKQFYYDNIDKYKEMLNTTAEFYNNIANYLP